MVKDIKYIIKRIIIGVGIVLLLSFIRGNLFIGVSAKGVSSVDTGPQTIQINNSLLSTASFNLGYNGAWAGWGTGMFYHSISVVKNGSDSVGDFPVLRGAVVYADGKPYSCSVGSVTGNNSTHQGFTYSATCPVDMGATGFNYIIYIFNGTYSASSAPVYYFDVNANSIFTFQQDDNLSVNVDTSGISNSINNQITNDNSNTNRVINNQNQNTESIINNQNDNTQREIESQMSCSLLDNKYTKNNGYLNGDGVITGTQSQILFTSDFIKISPTDKISLFYNTDRNYRLCVYSGNKTKLNCYQADTLTSNVSISLSSDSAYIRYSLNFADNVPTFQLCRNGNQAIVDSTNENTNAINNVNDTLNDDNVDGANSQASSFFENFQNNDHGLSAIISAPLNFIKSLGSSSCTPLKWKFGWFNDEFSLPCATSVISSNYPEFLAIYQTITFGIIAYVVVVRIFALVKGFKDPDSDKLEVLEL